MSICCYLISTKQKVTSFIRQVYSMHQGTDNSFIYYHMGKKPCFFKSAVNLLRSFRTQKCALYKIWGRMKCEASTWKQMSFMLMLHTSFCRKSCIVCGKKNSLNYISISKRSELMFPSQFLFQ